MSRQRIPEAVLDAAHARATARSEGRWDEADRLRAEIEAAGWRIVDRGTDFALSPAAAATIEAEGVVRYGSSAAVPSRRDEAPTGDATVVIVAMDWPGDLERALAGLRRHAPSDLSAVIAADGPSDDQDAALDRPALGGGEDRPIGIEVVRTSDRLGHAAALNVGLRRATGRVVIVLDTSVEPTGDIVTPLLDTLADPTVAVAGGWGIVSDDLRRFRDAPPGEVDAIEGYAMAFRREDARTRGPLDERFRYYRNLDIWWSLVLRDEGIERPPRRAVAVALPAIRHEHRGWAALEESERERLSRRNFYRILDRFGGRPDLARGGEDRG